MIGPTLKDQKTLGRNLSVLSSLRAPTPSPTLNENLTQIITIVSSIVAALQRQPSSPLCPTRQ